MVNLLWKGLTICTITRFLKGLHPFIENMMQKAKSRLKLVLRRLKLVNNL
jgi:hypothetical protein